VWRILEGRRRARFCSQQNQKRPDVRAGLTEPVKDQTASPEHRDHARQESREPLWRVVLGQQLRELRRSRRESLQSVAHRANLSLQYLSEVERGRKEPSSEIVAAIGVALGTSLLDLTEAVAEQLREERASIPASTRRGDVALAA
jgi:DNA-binding XRE family transcriptional regulator